MLQLKMIVRSWWRNGLSTSISIVSLTVGLICATMFTLFVVGEYRVADAIGGHNSYLLERQSPFYLKSKVFTASTTPILGLDIKGRYGEVESFITINEQNKEYVNAVQKYSALNIYKVSSDFCDVFNMPVKQGNLGQTLSQINEIAVTPEFFREIYGNEPKIGDKVICRNDSRMVVTVNGVPQPISDAISTYTITTILDDSGRLPFKMGALLPLSDDEITAEKDTYFGNFVSFIKLRQGVDADSFKGKVVADTMLTAMNESLTLTPFKDVYFSNRPAERWGGASFIVRRDPSILPIGIAIAFAVLLIATFNYINITMTRAKGRIRNIAAERIFGASARQVRRATIADTALLVLLSFGVALIFMHVLLPQFNGFMDSKLTLLNLFAGYNWAIIAALLALIIALSSIYILVRIEVKSPLESLKNPMGRGLKVSSIMVVAQFIISVVLVAVSINISRQMNFICNQVSGSSSIIQLASSERLPKEFVDKITSQAWVEQYSISPLLSFSSSSDSKHSANYTPADEMFFSLYNVELIAGRTFGPTESENSIIVNEALIRAFELEEPAYGKDLEFNGTKRIVGVVKDFIYENVKTAIQPLIITPINGEQQIESGIHQIFIKVKGDAANYIPTIRTMWATDGKLNGGSSLSAATVAEIYEGMHNQEQRLGTMVEIFMYISILLTALGLFGLSYYTVAGRTREIAIRKVHGSTTARIVAMLCSSFFRLVGLSVVIALPVAYYISAEWLSSFIYKINIAWWVFAITVAIAAFVTFVTVIGQTYIAASANPAKSIKSE